MGKISRKLIALILALTCLLSMLLIIGVDTDWGKVETTHMVLTSADGDEISAMLYKPKNASPDHKVPLAMICHGGNDMLEQVGTYAVELSRRGIAVVSWDYTGCHNSDIATGPAEVTPDEISGLPTMGAETVWNTVKSYDFVDFDKIITMGHSMGGQYTIAFAIAHQDEVFLQLNLGMNVYGSADNHSHNFNFVNVLGDSDESCLARSGNNVMSLFQSEQMKQIFYGDYDSDPASLPDIEISKVYTAIGTDGKEYTRTAYMPNSCHAYYLVTNDSIKTIIYAITSQVGVGLDNGVNSFADKDRISTVWKLKDFGFILEFLSVVGIMLLTLSSLLDSEYFGTLCLKPASDPSYKPGSIQRKVAIAVLALVPVLLYRPGILSSNKFLGIDISKIWLLAGTNNCYISWQWLVSITFLILFLIFHFTWGKKNGGDARAYGFAMGENKGFDIGYLLKAILFGIITVGSGYLTLLLISAYTGQGLHITTFMLTPLKPNRTLCMFVYFLFQIPYFLTSSLVMKSISSNTKETNAFKTILSSICISVGGLFLLWFIFILILNIGNTLTGSSYFATERMYIFVIAILPLFIGMSVANALNLLILKKTKCLWPGLFTALLWGSWMITCCGAISKYTF